MMAARVRHLLLCVSIASLLVMPLRCNASRTTEFEPGTRRLLSSASASDDDTEVPRNTHQKAPTSAMEKADEFCQWARFQQAQEVAIDYNPPEANPDPGNLSPSGG